ncbi:MAG: type I-U CRISPR-associated protein Cas7 [Deltaproteobacteria bacterium]|nr:type I-U CRISPR-associated protein Cas7 [Deltaproteobacteria bacterium]
MSEVVQRFDNWLINNGPAALVIREHLIPVEGVDGVLFPATFAESKDKVFKGGYNIDEFPDGTNVCLVDSVGSQANRIEPLFMDSDYSELIPQITVKAGSKKVNLLEAGHRAGDALVRCSTLQQELHDAFKTLLDGNAEPLARIAPTSLVFGAWDSRDTQAKLPRLIDSKIRAYNVRKLTRSAQFNPSTEYFDQGLLEKDVGKNVKDAYAACGFVHVPETGTHGGVIAAGGIRRDAVLHLAALRLLKTSTDEKTLALRRYILGLSLTALTAPTTGYLRQGCNLVPDIENPPEFTLVHCDGQRENARILHNDALAYAKSTASAFGVASALEVDFNKETAKKLVADAIKKESVKKDVADATKKKGK